MDEYKKYEPIFGSWKLERLIGKGSFGKVFEISREDFGTKYKAALKIITVPQDEDDVKLKLTEGTDIGTISEYYEGILREIINENEIMSKLKGNSNIVSYEDHQIIPHDDGIGYDVLIRMELLTPLLDRMVEKKLEEKEVVKLGMDICKALELCHKKKIIHRDIKPQNIFISDSGDYKLGDFGIARTMEKTMGGMSKKGTYKYMAPEVFRGDDYDHTVDIYSLGIVLYSLLNGNRSPFLPAPPAKVTHNDEEEARMRRFRGEPLPPPKEAGAMLTYILRKAAAANPAERYQTAAQFRKDLESYLKNYKNKAEETMGFDEEATVLESSIPLQSEGIRPLQQGYTGSMPAQRYTGSMPAVGGMAQQPYVQQQSQGKGKSKIPLIAAVALLVVAVTAAGTFVFKTMNKDETKTGSYVLEAEEHESAEILSSDWDFDNKVADPSTGNLKVYSILWVRNNTDHSITAVEFSCTKGDKEIENSESPGEDFIAYGFIKSNKSGLMVCEALTNKEFDKEADSYSVNTIYANDSLEEYEVPSGNVVNYVQNGDYYNVTMRNPNNKDVGSNYLLVAATVDGDNITEADAVRSNIPIKAEEQDALIEMAFVDPKFRSDWRRKKVFAIDIDEYEIDR